MRAKDVDILIVPGLGGSGEDHWQSRWERRLATARRVQQDDWERPDRAAWRVRILEAIGLSSRPAVLVAHSVGVISAVDALNSPGVTRVAAAFLVAPPDPEDRARRPDAIRGFAPISRQPLPCPAILVASRTDPYGTFEHASALAEDWRALPVDAGDAGHINSDSGFGPWPDGLLLFARLLRNLTTATAT